MAPWCHVISNGRGAVGQKVYTPTRTAPRNSYPQWHKISKTLPCQNPTLSGTLLENPTLCGTEIGQNGTLAILAYAYCRQWKCPPPGKWFSCESADTWTNRHLRWDQFYTLDCWHGRESSLSTITKNCVTFLQVSAIFHQNQHHVGPTFPASLLSYQNL